MKTVLRIAGLLIWLGLLIVAGTVLLFGAASRVGEHKSSTYGSAYYEFQNSWGGEIGVVLPKFHLKRTYIVEKYNATAKKYEKVRKTETFPLTPQQAKLETTLNYSEQERGWLMFNAFETDNQDHYQISNTTPYEGELYATFTKPINANLVHNYQLFVGEQADNGLLPSDEAMLLVDNFKPEEITDISVTYATKGMDLFKYNLSDYQAEVIGALQATITVNTPDFEIYRFGLPHQITSQAEGTTIAFNVNNFATTQDLGITFSSKQIYLDQIEAMLFYSPITLILYLLVILTFSQILEVRFNAFHYLFIGIINLFYFLFVAYLIRFFGVGATFAIASVLTAGMFFAYCPNVFGKSFAYRIAGPYLVALTIVYSLIFLMPIFRGLLFVSLIFLIFISIMISISRSDISKWQLVRGPSIVSA